MRLKNIIAGLVCSFPLMAAAQENPDFHYTQGEKDSLRSVYEKLESIQRKTDKFNVYFNMQAGFDVNANDETTTEFKARQLRLEIRGNLTNNVFYRFRHRLNKATNAQSLDNLAKATDMMYVGYNASDKFSMIFGKQCLAWGGFEFDLNPIDIYEYSDMIEYMDNFMLGANFIFRPAKNHEINLQVTDTRNNRIADEYGAEMLINSGIEPARSPMTYIVNWNGSMLDDKLQTRWSYGVEHEAKKYNTQKIAIGTKLNLPAFKLAVDYMRSDDDMDRSLIATGYTTQFYKKNAVAKDVDYNTFIAKAELPFADKWNFFVKGMYETAGLPKDDNFGKDFRKAYGYFAGIEHRPFKEEDLKLFLVYVGRKYTFADALKQNNGDIFKDHNTNRVSLGMIYRIKPF